MFPENRLLELMIIGAVALIVVGPKDLPILMRRVGQFVGKMRGMANEFRASFEDLARQSELEDLRKEVEAMRADHRSLTQFNPMAADYSAPGFTAHEDPPAPAAVMTSITPQTPAPETVSPPAESPPVAAKPKRVRKPRTKTPPPEAS
ncbi:MAG TPA: Sec-independent protein translocase protein TatB [Caulobacteraceae bacterium]